MAQGGSGCAVTGASPRLTSSARTKAAGPAPLRGARPQTIFAY